jgi:hypothetical protein
MSAGSTTNLHIANLCKMLGVPFLGVTATTRLTPQGTPEIRWGFQGTPEYQEIVALWRDRGMPVLATDSGKSPFLDWNQFSKEEKELVIEVVAAFCNHLKHTVREAKTGRPSQ